VIESRFQAAFVVISIVATSVACSVTDGTDSAELSSVRSREALATSDASGKSDADASNAGGNAVALSRIQAYLDARYTAKDVRHTFESQSGQTIDCIDFFAQPGVKAMAARGTPIKEIPKPPPLPADMPSATGVPDYAFNAAPDRQGRSRACSQNSVPMLRISVQDILAAGGLDAFERRQNPALNPPLNPEFPGYAHVNVECNNYPTIQTGAANFSVYPSLMSAKWNNHNISQTWLQSGQGYNYNGQTCSPPNCKQSVEVGVKVEGPGFVYTPSQPYFFVFATNNGYGDCDGQASCPTWIAYGTGTVAQGLAIPSQFTDTVGVTRQTDFGVMTTNSVTSGWWVWAAGNWAGYFPTANFTGSMRKTADSFLVGGEIFDADAFWSTPMGSGAAPEAGLNQAVYFHDFWTTAFDSNGFAVSSYAYTPMPISITEYGYSTNSPSPVPSQWKNYFFVGNEPRVFWGQNYGYQWSPVNLPTYGTDWAYGYYKGECGYTSVYGGSPVTGVSAYTTGSRQAHAIQCNYINPVSTTGNQCYAVTVSPNNAMNCNANGNWDPHISKTECHCGDYVLGISQGNNGIYNILCCPGNMAHASCTTQNFYGADSSAFGPNSPDWDYGYFKGQCPVGQYVAGISSIVWSSDGVLGAPHALLCCQ